MDVGLALEEVDEAGVDEVDDGTVEELIQM